MMGTPPVVVLKEGTQRERGRSAQDSNIMAARAVAEAVRSVLGPRGMDKMLVDARGDVVITNDGATILQKMDVAHPVARMVIEVSKVQDQEVGDGTTGAVVLAGELLRQAEALVQDIHPTLIVKGYRLAAGKAIAALEDAAIRLDVDSDRELRLVPLTSMGSKASTVDKELLADIALRAVRAVAEPRDGGLAADVRDVQVVKRHGGGIADTELIQGIIVDKPRAAQGMPRSVRDARILLLARALEVAKPEVDAEIRIREPAQIEAFLAEEERLLRRMVDQAAHVGATAVFCSRGIDEVAQHFLARAGIYAVQRASDDDLEKLARATGGRVGNDLEELDKDDLGRAALVEERRIGEEALTFVTGCERPASVSVLIRGGSQQVVDEVERNLHDGLRVTAVVLQDGGRVLPGGGAPEVAAALRLRAWAPTVGGREQLAIEAFADALEVIPRTLAENAGLDAVDVLVAVREAHGRGQSAAGVDVMAGKVQDMRKRNVLDPLAVKAQAIRGAAEVATMILRIDDVIAARGAPRPGGTPLPPGAPAPPR